MNRQVKLISCLPEYIREYREIKCLMDAENPEVQMLEDETEIIKNNQFILGCGISGIARFEKLAGIVPEPNASLEDRKRRVLEKWGTSIPYNYAGLRKRLDALCWNEGYVIRPDFDAYEIEILVSLIERGQIRDLEWICDTYIPANMELKIHNKIPVYPENKMYMGGVSSLCLEVNFS